MKPGGNEGPQWMGGAKQNIDCRRRKDYTQHMPVNIGYGFKNLRARISSSFWIAILLLVLAYASDTVTTITAGSEACRNDINPFIRNLTPTGYIIGAMLRCVVAVCMLIWFWPGRLQIRFSKHRWLSMLIPFSYKQPSKYFGAVLIMIATPAKVLAAMNNFYIYRGSLPGISPMILILIGIVLGILYGNILLYWQYR